MAISRMQQPRQNYGLGSFVKKITRKVTKPFTKVASKIVPKEIAGIMRVAAPFLPPGYREAAYLLGTAKQTGRISPMDLALTALPTVGKIPFGQSQMSAFDRIGGLNVPFTGGKDISEILVGNKQGTIRTSLNGGQVLLDPSNPATEGIFGKGGSMYKIGGNNFYQTIEDETFVPRKFGIFDTKAGQKLFGTYSKEKGAYVPSFTKLGSIGIGVFDLISSAKTAKEAGELYADSTGNPDDAIEGEKLFSILDPKTAFPIKDQFVLKQNAAGGGLMRTNYAMGSDDEPKPLPEDPTKPVNPFGPKPIGPFPSDMAEIPKGLSLEKAKEMFIEFNGRKPVDMQELLEFFNVKQQAAGGGLMRSNYALGSRPTDQESGLGGLPIEADMRYTGGFMPYGAVEKADDVPARLSKNEFVFTADAVRAAGGGSVQKGAKKMYDTMKQLEQQPEAKGAMA
jgi:hypothetical protein